MVNYRPGREFWQPLLGVYVTNVTAGCLPVKLEIITDPMVLLTERLRDSFTLLFYCDWFCELGPQLVMWRLMQF